MDSDYVGWMIAVAIAEFFSKAIWFCCGWFLVYVFLGAWLKVRLAGLRLSDDFPREKRLGPVFVSNILFSIILVNPYTLLVIFWKADQVISSVSGMTLLAILYFTLLPIAWDILLLRVAAQWKRLSWFQWRGTLKRMIPASLVVSLIALGMGYAAVQFRDVAPTLVRAFPLRPTGFSWKVDTGVKSLVDGSVTAETDRMIMDDEYVYVRTDSKRPTWVIVDRKHHKVLASESKPLAYVLADDAGGTWQIKRDNREILCSRVSGMEAKRVALSIPESAVFLEHQMGGLIIGANPDSGHLFAFDPKAGNVLWKVQAPPAKNNDDRRIGSIASTGDVIVAGLWTCRVWAVDAGTGQHLWLFEEAGMGNPMHVEASKSGVMGFSRSGKVYSFWPRTGELKWSKKIGDIAGGIGTGNVCVSDDKVIFRDNTTVACLDVNSDAILWQTDFGDHYSGGVSCSKEGVVAAASDRTLVVLNSDTGQRLFQTKFPIGSGIDYGYSNSIGKSPGRIYTHPIVTVNGEIYVFTSDGVLWVLKPRL